jgi:hypothetical protein
MSREIQELVLMLFIAGALARSIAIGLGHMQVGALFGLISTLAIMYAGVRYLLSPNKKDRWSKVLQRVGGLLVIAISLVFCLSLLMELLT